MKETFIVRTEWYDFIQDLSQEERAIILDNLFFYHMNKENLINLNNPQVKLVWKFIAPNLKRNIESYDKRKETSVENGKLGGRPRKDTSENLNNLNKPTDNQIEPNETLSVPAFVLVSVPESVSASETVQAEAKEIPQFVKDNQQTLKDSLLEYSKEDTVTKLLEDTGIIEFFGMKFQIKEPDKFQKVIQAFIIHTLPTKAYPRNFLDTKQHIRNWASKTDLKEILNKSLPNERPVFNQARNFIN